MKIPKRTFFTKINLFHMDPPQNPTRVFQITPVQERPHNFVSLSLIFKLLEVQLVNQQVPASVNFLDEALTTVFGLGEAQTSITLFMFEIYFVNGRSDKHFKGNICERNIFFNGNIS